MSLGPTHSGLADAPSVWMSVIFVKPLRVLRAAAASGPVVSRSKSASLSSVSCVPLSLRTNALLPLAVGNTSPAFGRMPSRNGIAAPVSNSLPTASTTEVAAALERSCTPPSSEMPVEKVWLPPVCPPRLFVSR